MTREEAIGVLEDVRDAICENIPGSHPELDELKEAVKMAANALVKCKAGKWEQDNPFTKPRCSECGEPCFGLHGFDYTLTPFCPNCGADMRGEGHE